MLEEAKFFGISKATEPLEAIVATEERSVSGHFSRKEFLRMLSITSSSSILRCQVLIATSVLYTLPVSTVKDMMLGYNNVFMKKRKSCIYSFVLL